jgi:glycosyltransferase involved in cell wall biosynthesis
MANVTHKTEIHGSSNNCKISVIIPVFNTEKYLPRCLDSVLAQTFTDFELILVDDCSPDGSPAICDEYARKDPRVKVIHNAQNKGCPQSRKTGLDASVGDYILFADSDDWLENDMLETMYGKAVNDDLDMVYCGIYENTSTGQQEWYSPFLDDKIEMIRQIVIWENFTPAVWNKLIKREIYQKINFPNASFSEDRQITLQAIYYAHKIGYTKKILYHYYKNENSICNSIDRNRILQRLLDEAEIAAWVIDFLYNNYNAHFELFEPELSDYIISLKMRFVREKSIRNYSVSHDLYPPSNRRIFNPAWRELFIDKVILFLSIHDRTFIAADILDMIVHAIKAIYRIIIPKNLRSSIWQKRTNSKDIEHRRR